MSRSLKKGPYVDHGCWPGWNDSRRGHREPLKTLARDCTIVPDFIGHTFLVHNGRQFIKLFVTEDMVGHKLGEFAPTRLFEGTAEARRKAAAAAAAAAPPSQDRSRGGAVVARQAHNLEVVGSNPTPGTMR